MALVPVIFEDETLAGFRPLTWSQPVSELRCGLLNLRERLTHITGEPPIQLLRDFLVELATSHGHRIGTEALSRAATTGARLLLVNGRLGARWDLLDDLVQTASVGDLAWRDDSGWLAFSVAGEAARALLDSWSAWQAEASASGSWRRADRHPPVWQPVPPTSVVAMDGAWRRIWDLVPATAEAIRLDLERLGDRLPQRKIWGALPADPDRADWTAPVELVRWSEVAQEGVQVRGAGELLVGPGCDIAPGVAIDTSAGPVILGRDVRVMPHSYLEGPLFIGSGSLVKSGTAIYGETSLGAVNKVAGEIAESTFLDFTNKQHEGFIGHAYVGSWCNLGAMTTCSDLKNTYGNIRVDLGSGPEDSGQRFIGLLMGEHGKTAIGTLFNTATVVGFASNVFGQGFPAKFLPCFTWGDGRAPTGDQIEPGRQDPERALSTATVVMARRGCTTATGHATIFRFLAG